MMRFSTFSRGCILLADFRDIYGIREPCDSVTVSWVQHVLSSTIGALTVQTGASAGVKWIPANRFCSHPATAINMQLNPFGCSQITSFRALCTRFASRTRNYFW